MRSRPEARAPAAALPGARQPGQFAALAASLILAAALAARLAGDGWRLPALFAVGLLLGGTLHHAAFGFAGAYRKLILGQGSRGVLAQLLMVAFATLLFAPFLAAGEVLGRPVIGAIAPAGLSVAAGAFAFGVGMQLAGGCGSGTLYGLGGGNLRLLCTLAAFCAGAFWASLHMNYWQSLPNLAESSLGELIGWPQAVAAQLAALALLAVLIRGLDGAAPAVPRAAAAAPRWRALGRQALVGPWPLAVGALVLALLNLLTLLIAGHPWTVTWAFALWGAKMAGVLGWSSAGDPFWDSPFAARALEASVLTDVTSVMDIGIVLGAGAAAALAGRFTLRPLVPFPALLAAALGGLLMGYGARVSYGCNIGAFFSGVASTSLHGWIWMAAAMAGSWIGVRLRPGFGMRD